MLSQNMLKPSDSASFFSFSTNHLKNFLSDELSVLESFFKNSFSQRFPPSKKLLALLELAALR